LAEAMNYNKIIMVAVYSISLWLNIVKFFRDIWSINVGMSKLIDVI